ncbi:hypothetical protein ACHAQH_001404 [Verticillium albo-atrum]
MYKALEFPTHEDPIVTIGWVNDTPKANGADNRIIAPVRGEHLKALYLPIAVEKALTNVCHVNHAVTSNIGAGENLNIISEASVYQVFLDKFAQACDNEKGGTTVTAVTVPQLPEGPVFVLTFNDQTTQEADGIASWFKSLLNMVGKNPDDLKPKPLQKRVLWRILRHHVHRVDRYLYGLIASINECIDHCLRHGETNDCATVQELRKLKSRAEFPRHVLTSDASQDKFLSDCETVIKAALAMKNTALDKSIQSRARQGQVTEASCWCSLRHFIGRFLSYRQAAEVITSAATKWPELFDKCAMRVVPSSWKAMGVSKPLSRLCHYYFTNHPDKIRVRSQHSNIYPCWRLPDVFKKFKNQGHAAIKARDRMVDCIIRPVTQDPIKTLQDKLARRKPYDSNTYTSIPHQFRSGSDSGDESGVALRMSSATTQTLRAEGS